ncbi:MAG: hypothetical protein ACI9DF_003488 [Verrucomicrobiales bacterium]|jgi:hypothetical protein
MFAEVSEYRLAWHATIRAGVNGRVVVNVWLDAVTGALIGMH